MAYKLLFSIFFFLLIANLASAQSQSTYPMIRGNVDISITKGTIACDFFVTDLPDVKNYVIRLNSGMNLHYFKDVGRSNDALYYDADTKDSIMSDETKAYFVHENRGNPARYLPKELEIKYMGMYPVIRDSVSGYMGADWRGNVAFNGYSVRAEGLQGCWYPVLYDKDTRVRYTDVRYNINVTCKDCSVLFVNGSKPVRGTKANLVSTNPRQMALYCGKFKANESNGVWLLNSDMQKADEQKLFTTAKSYQDYYVKQTGIPFNGSLSFIQTTPVANPKNWGFAFFVAPTTINVAVGKYGMASMFNAANGPNNKKTMAHELAHYYFGSLLTTDGEFGHVVDESFAEYMALNLTKNLESDQDYREVLQKRITPLKYLHNYKPWAQVVKEADYGNREYYLYYYGPVLLTAIEKEIGEEPMRQWLRLMLADKPQHTDYNFVLSTFKKAVHDTALQEKVIGSYFTSTSALNTAIAKIGL